jgi:hypothetical protein
MSKQVEINKRIFGLPLGFTKLADPNFRIFNKLFVRGATIITVVPGLPKFSNGNTVAAKYAKLQEEVNDESGSATHGVWKNPKTVVEFNKDYYHDNGGNTQEYERDRRYYTFTQSMGEYRKVVNVLLNEVGAKVAAYGFFNLDSYISTVEAAFAGLQFYADNSTTISESATNTLGDSILTSTAKQMSEKLREVAFLAGKSENEVLDADIGEGGLASITGMLSAVSSKIAGEVSANAANVMLGETVLYPKVWKDSSFDKSYNLSFKFVSPYGDPASIFEYVYMPFLMLLALALPRQTQPNAYKAPFLVRLDCPGYFNCDMGMITSFSFVRGGSDGMWNENGLPMCIEVTMSVTDMYPALMVATNIALLRNNIGLSTFLDNMCGLAVMKANIRANIRGSIASKIAMFAGIEGAMGTYATDVLSRTMSSITKVFNF